MCCHESFCFITLNSCREPTYEYSNNKFKDLPDLTETSIRFNSPYNIRASHDKVKSHIKIRTAASHNEAALIRERLHPHKLLCFTFNDPFDLCLLQNSKFNNFSILIE